MTGERGEMNIKAYSSQVGPMFWKLDVSFTISVCSNDRNLSVHCTTINMLTTVVRLIIQHKTYGQLEFIAHRPLQDPHAVCHRSIVS